MTDINNLNAADSLTDADLIPVWSSGNSATRRVSVYALAVYLQNVLTAGGGMVTQYSAPNSSGYSTTVTPPVDGATMWLLLTPDAAYAAGTVVLPAPIEGQEVLVTTTQAITALNVSGNGKAVVGAPTTLAQNAFFRVRFDAPTDSWYRIS